jgi:hypothetical protein
MNKDTRPSASPDGIEDPLVADCMRKGVAVMGPLIDVPRYFPSQLSSEHGLACSQWEEGLQTPDNQSSSASPVTERGSASG